MATPMQKVTASWSGMAGAPGITTFFLQGSSIIDPSVFKTFFDAVVPYLPSNITIQVNGGGELVDPELGHVTGTWPGAAPPVQAGTGTATTLLVAEGIQMRLETGAFRRGKHIRGRIYLIPVLGSTVSSVGTVTSTVVTALNTAGATLRSATGAQLGVWHRPLKDYSVKPPIVKEPGEFIACTSFTTQSKVAVLRSRRD